MKESHTYCKNCRRPTVTRIQFGKEEICDTCGKTKGRQEILGVTL